mmetsp:Transcript_34685/g.78286  ORF Transcript_34685/g.78286 Transcript_34685/m.78286 type:complete len:248 (+) Transcript_34685:547-1290(+)
MSGETRELTMEKYSPLSSTRSITRCCISTLSTGYLPEALSAESITASAPSKTAVATSLASARVGTGCSIMDSSICVATTTGLPILLHSSMILLWIIGTSSGAHSTPKSPRATMQASEAATTSGRLFTAAGFSILAMMLARLPTSPRSSCMSSARCTKLSATQSTFMSSAAMRSVRSFGVRGEMGRTMDGVLTPLRSDSRPPTSTSHSTRSEGEEEEEEEGEVSTLNLSFPSSRRRMSPSRSVEMISG